MREFLYLSVYYFLKIYVFCMNDFMLKKTAKFVAKLVFKLDKKHRKIIDVNLKMCFESLNEEQRNALALELYENFALFGIDVIKYQNATKEQLLQKVSFENDDIIKEALAKKRAIVFTTAHFGNWEFLSLAYAAKFGAISIVGRELDSKKMDKFLSKNRTQFDIELIDKKGGLKKMLRAIKNKRALGILTDQNAADSESMELEFFGKRANWLVGASVIAKKTEALLIPIFICKNGESYSVKLYPALDSLTHSKEELTLYQAKCCEDIIKQRPQEYFFFHRRFKNFYPEIYQ